MNQVSVYEWRGETKDHAAALTGLFATGEHVVLGQSFAIPTREDYGSAYRASGALGEEEELADRPELVAAAQAHWHAAGHNACVFAAHMSAGRDDNGWQTLVLGEGASPADVAVALARAVAPLLVAAEAEVVSVLLPHLSAPADMALLLRRLEQLPSWSISDEGEEEDDQHGTVVRLGVRVLVDFGFLSEVLGFGPCAEYGATRRAPFTELLIRAKPPTKRPRHRRAFVAHYQIPGLGSHETGQWWAQTTSNRIARLGPDHNDRAKARVTVALPKMTWLQENA